MVLFTSCEKDAVDVFAENTATSAPTNYRYADPAGAQKKLDQLNAFAAVVEESSVASFDKSSGDKYTIDETKQNIEALANVSFSRGMENLGSVSVQRDSFEIPLVNGEVSLADAVDGYLEAHQKLLAHYLSINTDDKQVMTTILQVGPVASNTVRFYISTEIGVSGSSMVLADCEVFDKGYWVGPPINGDQGECFPGSSNENTNATKQLDQKLKEAVILQNSEIVDDPFFYGWLELQAGNILDVGTIIDWIDHPNTDPVDVPNDGIRDYLVYTGFDDAPNVLECLTDDDMNWYLCNYVSLVNSEPQVIGKTLVTTKVSFDHDCICEIKAHNIVRYYGTPLFSPDDTGYVKPDQGTHDPSVIGFEIVP